MGGSPTGFNKADVIAGLHTAMNFGAPNSADDRATFCWTDTTAVAGADESGVPFDPDVRPARTPHKITVPCAVDHSNAGMVRTRFGTYRPDRIEITLLDPDFQKVKDFTFVVWGGDKYVRGADQVIGLGSLDVHTIQCIAEDES